MTFLWFLFIYILGGLTFIPSLIIVIFYLLPQQQQQEEIDDSNDVKTGEIEEQNGLETYKVGWIIVTRDHIESPDDINSTMQSITESSETKSAYSTLYKIAKEEETDDDREEEVTPQQSNVKPKKHKFYAILKHGNLFLYKDQSIKDVKHVIVMSNYFVSIWPRDLTDVQLFTKYSCIALINCNNLKSLNSHSKGSFYIYVDNNYDKEDWYFALIRSTKLKNKTSEIPSHLNPNIEANTLHFKTKDMINLIQTLYSSDSNLQTKWINALIGRWYLGIKDTSYFKNYIEVKFNKKLNKIKRPDFLNQFKITNVEPGNSAPFFTYPNLKEINPDGTVLVSSYISYNGNISITIETKLDITFGGFTKFTNKKEVDIVLKITLLKLQGPILIKFKPPPSNRIWYTYETEPILNFKIEPLVSTKALNFNFITNSIEKKFKENFKESMVLPHWDDLVFFDTKDQLYKGGIWKEKEEEETEETEVSVEAKEKDSESISQPPTIVSDSDIELKSSDVKSKFTSTIKKMAKKQSTLNLEETSPTTTIPTESTNYTNYFKKFWNSTSNSTLNNHKDKQPYTPPEMISNRRPRRSTSNSLSSSISVNNLNNDIPDQASIRSEPTIGLTSPQQIQQLQPPQPSLSGISPTTTTSGFASPTRSRTLRKPPPKMDDDVNYE
ncbi:unnamed protein product [Candida verbasci]|uniref:SMP-LTD domain-containing protein n=1 Tax=Candida verbasci TaxID=1227364 RepID=A0A9W4TYN1_9ASCO|nr:unnamed protein product [Candida verbasci]